MINKIRSLSNEEAISFLKKCKANKEQVAYDKADKWLGCYVRANWYSITCKKLVGTIGISTTKNVARIKGLYVLKDNRGNYLGTSLVEKALQQPEVINKKRTTLYATKYSKNIFARMGYEIKSVNKYNVSFMERVMNK